MEGSTVRARVIQRCIQARLKQGYTIAPHGRAWTVLIWNVAPGRSLVSACTVVLMPKFASAPRITPQGNQRYCNQPVSSTPSWIRGPKEPSYRLCHRNSLPPYSHAHSRKRPERTIGQDVDTLYQAALELCYFMSRTQSCPGPGGNVHGGWFSNCRSVF